MSISAQLKKMSHKTIEFITENDELKAKIQTLKRQNDLLAGSEKELAKKSNSNQKLIKILVNKLKEGDQMLELAFEENAFVQEQQNPFSAPLMAGQDGLTDEMIEVA